MGERLLPNLKVNAGDLQDLVVWIEETLPDKLGEELFNGLKGRIVNLLDLVEEWEPNDESKDGLLELIMGGKKPVQEKEDECDCGTGEVSDGRHSIEGVSGDTLGQDKGPGLPKEVVADAGGCLSVEQDSEKVDEVDDSHNGVAG
jgi:hypothetical protein